MALTQVKLAHEHILSIFLIGLDKQTQMHVHMFKQTSMIHTTRLARLYEASLHTKTLTIHSYKPSLM